MRVADAHAHLVERVHAAMREFGAKQPALLVLAAGMNGRVLTSDTVRDMELSAGGRLLVNPKFAAHVSPRVLAGSAFHVLLHPAFRHASRRAGREEAIWWIACDMLVNDALRQAGLGLPSHAVRVPGRYEGPRQVEALYEWLRRHARTQACCSSSGTRKGPEENLERDCSSSARGARGRSGPAGRGAVDDVRAGARVGQSPRKHDSAHGDGVPRRVGAGCGVDASPAVEDAIAGCLQGMPGEGYGAGYGLHQLMLQLVPEQPRVHWRRVLRTVISTRRVHGYTSVSWTRPNYRREVSDDVILPTWRDQTFRLGIIVDVSGSMPRAAIQRVVAEARSIVRACPRVSIWLASHTDEPCFAGDVRELDDAVVQEALSFTGGTDPTSTYEAARKAGRFDAVVHFTDRVFIGSWPPVPPGARLIVGDFPSTDLEKAMPPRGSVIVACTQLGEFEDG